MERQGDQEVFLGRSVGDETENQMIPSRQEARLRERKRGEPQQRTQEKEGEEDCVTGRGDCKY